ncbi:MAG: hydantoinase B/oxoprolinase family protein [Deltaproteobacteria bacterium]|nr:hydantoinase B/oxoprolinase family protein [Nannocystaceae bacterium]
MSDPELRAAATAVLDVFAQPVAGDGERFARALGRGIAFSDDVLLPDDTLAVRVRIDDDGPGRWRVDLRDCSVKRGHSAWAIASTDDARLAALLAFAAFDTRAGPDARLAEAIALELEPGSWVGHAEPSDDPCFRAFAICRIYDAIVGALEKAWPDRGRAGSCSLGAIITARTGEHALVDIVAGGRGGGADGPGTTWPGPLLPATTLRGCEGIAVTHAPREGSAGVGARNGGDGVVARYVLTGPTCVRVAIDRQHNPPHGLDRAGAGLPARVHVIDPDGVRRELAPWHEHLLECGNVVEVETAGGGGHGFPGWGDIEWDPSILG